MQRSSPTAGSPSPRTSYLPFIDLLAQFPGGSPRQPRRRQNVVWRPGRLVATFQPLYWRRDVPANYRLKWENEMKQGFKWTFFIELVSKMPMNELEHFEQIYWNILDLNLYKKTLVPIKFEVCCLKTFENKDFIVKCSIVKLIFIMNTLHFKRP